MVKKQGSPLDDKIDERKEKSSSSEGSYDSEDDLNSNDLSELEEQMYQTQIKELEKNDEEDDRANASLFVDELIDMNDFASEKADINNDMIVLIDSSELGFITYAQEKLVKNKALIETRAREHEAKKGQERFIQ